MTINSEMGQAKPSARRRMRNFANQLTRTKIIKDDVMVTNLNRCLNTFDVTLLSLGHMVGSGVYVLTPTVARNTAGPAIVISYLIGGVASFLAALCYAELGVRYPRSGSAYSYTYLALGEFWAFIVGWNVALEHTISAAAISRACSSYVDSLAHNVIRNSTDRWVGHINVDFITNLDFFSLGIVLLFLFLLSFGVHMTSSLNNVISLINISICILIICVGGYYADTSNWTNAAKGGFMPYGFSGVLSGAATCFYSYIGFDSIAASAEEANDPKRSIPLATMISMSIAAALYIGVGAVLTLMVNYQDISMVSGLPDALARHGSYWAETVVTVGAICGMTTGLIGCLYALTRVVYAMAEDGLLFNTCASVNKRTRVPLISLYVFGALAAVLTFLLDVETLTQLISIGTLVAYLLVSASVIVIRYQPIVSSNASNTYEMTNVAAISPKINDNHCVADNSNHDSRDSIPCHTSRYSCAELVKSNSNKSEQSEEMKKRDGLMCDRFAFVDEHLEWPPGRLVNLNVFFLVTFSFAIGIFFRVCGVSISKSEWWAILVIIVLFLGLIVPLIIIRMHQQTTYKLDYKVPLVPLLPALSIFINAYLICSLAASTFIRLIVWIFIGLVIYFAYGMKHSKLNISSGSEEISTSL